MTDTNQELIDIVIENKYQDDNAICGLLIQSGVPFNKAKGVLNEILISQGLRMTKVQRDDKAEELMVAFKYTEIGVKGSKAKMDYKQYYDNLYK